MSVLIHKYVLFFQIWHVDVFFLCFREDLLPLRLVWAQYWGPNFHKIHNNRWDTCTCYSWRLGELYWFDLRINKWTKSMPRLFQVFHGGICTKECSKVYASSVAETPSVVFAVHYVPRGIDSALLLLSFIRAKCLSMGGDATLMLFYRWEGMQH